MDEISSTAEYQDRVEKELRLEALRSLAKAYTKEHTAIGRELYPSILKIGGLAELPKHRLNKINDLQ